MTDTIFVDIDTVSVWHTLTMRVREYIVNEYMDAYEKYVDMWFLTCTSTVVYD